MSKQPTIGEPVTRPRYRIIGYPTPEAVAKARREADDDRDQARSILVYIAEAAMANYAEPANPGEIVIRLSGEDGEMWGNAIGEGWGNVVAGMALNYLEGAAKTRREVIRAEEQRRALAEIDDVDALRARLDELESDDDPAGQVARVVRLLDEEEGKE